MIVEDIMTADPECCAPGTGLREVARLMVDCDCGEIPVCDALGRPVGVITDRDIVCRIVAVGRNPLEAAARDCMSTSVITCSPDTDVEDCAWLMEQHQVRRLPVVDEDGVCCGMIAQADLARKGPRDTTMDAIGRISEPATMSPAAV